MPYSRAFSSLGCPTCSLDEVFALARRHGLDAVELRALGGSIDLPAYFSQVSGSPAALKQRRREAPVAVAALDTGLRLVEASPADREKFLAHLPWAEALDARWLRVFDGGATGNADELARAAATVEWWRARRKAEGWKADIIVETHDSLFTADAIGRFLEQAPGTAMLWDSHHTWRRGGEDPVKTWRAIKSSVVHIHVKDSVSRGPEGGYVYVLPGAGEFPMAPLRAVLQEAFSGTLSLEWEKLWHPELASLEEALGAAAANRWW